MVHAKFEPVMLSTCGDYVNRSTLFVKRKKMTEESLSKFCVSRLTIHE